MSAAAAIARRLVIAGRVQGVGFRYAFADEARMRGLAGWVRNRRDGRVEALVSGPAPAVEAMIAWARRRAAARRASRRSKSRSDRARPARSRSSPRL